MKKIATKICSARPLWFVMLLLFQASVWADVAVIVHKSNMLDSIDKTMLKSVFMGKLKSWPNGQTIMLADNEPGSDTRKVFLKKIIKKSERKFDSYWSKRVYSGKGMPPKAMTEDIEIIEWVAKNKNSIAFIDSSVVNGTVKVLIIVK